MAFEQKKSMDSVNQQRHIASGKDIEDSVYRIGHIGKPHGVKGEIAFYFDDDIFDRAHAEYLFLRVEGILVPFFIDDYRFKGNATALMKFADVDSEEQARELMGCEVYMPRAAADEDSGMVSWRQMTGMKLVDADTNKPTGIISDVDDSNPNVLFNVTLLDGRTILVPANEQLIDSIDMDEGTVSMTLPKGLLDL